MSARGGFLLSSLTSNHYETKPPKDYPIFQRLSEKQALLLNHDDATLPVQYMFAYTGSIHEFEIVENVLYSF